MLFREHKGSLDKSMKTVVELKDIDELVKYISDMLQPFGMSVTPDSLHTQPYGYDNRIDWETYIVTLDGYGVVGFIKGINQFSPI